MLERNSPSEKERKFTRDTKHARVLTPDERFTKHIKKRDNKEKKKAENKDRFARIRVELTPLDAAEEGEITVNFDTELSGNLLYSTNIPEVPIKLKTNDPHVYEFWSTDGGLNVFVNYLGRYRTPS